MDNAGSGGELTQTTEQVGRHKDDRVLPEPGDQRENEPREDALHAAHAVKPADPTYLQGDRYISILEAYEIAFGMATERAYGTAVRPEDSPRGWKEAMARPDREKWMASAQTEIDALIANGTWELVELPPGCRAIGSRWVFLVKRQADSTIDRYKAVRFCNLIDWSLYDRDFVHTCLWHGPLNSTRCLFVYGRAVQVLLTVQYTWTHIMWVLIM